MYLLRPPTGFQLSEHQFPYIVVKLPQRGYDVEALTQMCSQPFMLLPPIANRDMQWRIPVSIPQVDIAGIMAQDGVEH